MVRCDVIDAWWHSDVDGAWQHGDVWCIERWCQGLVIHWCGRLGCGDTVCELYATEICEWQLFNCAHAGRCWRTLRKGVNSMIVDLGSQHICDEHWTCMPDKCINVADWLRRLLVREYYWMDEHCVQLRRLLVNVTGWLRRLSVRCDLFNYPFVIASRGSSWYMNCVFWLWLVEEAPSHNRFALLNIDTLWKDIQF